MREERANVYIHILSLSAILIVIYFGALYALDIIGIIRLYCRQ